MHDHPPVEPPADKPHPAVDLAQAALAVDVFGVLGTIALGSGRGYRPAHAGALLAPQPLELLPQGPRTLRGDVLRPGRGRDLRQTCRLEGAPVNYVALAFTESVGSVEHLTDANRAVLLTCDRGHEVLHALCHRRQQSAKLEL